MNLNLRAIEKIIGNFFEENLWPSTKSGVLNILSNDIFEQISTHIQKKKKPPFGINIYLKTDLKNELSRREISQWQNFLRRIITEEMRKSQIFSDQPVQTHVDFIDGLKEDYRLKITTSSSNLRKTANIKIHNIDESKQTIIPGYLITPDKIIFKIKKTIINIGRSKINDLVLENLRVSRVHAQIRQIKGKHVIFDLDSTHGIKVNNERTTQKSLSHGDVIEIADIALIYDTNSERKSGFGTIGTRIIKTDF